MEIDENEPDHPASWDHISQRREAARKQSRRRAVWMILALAVMLVVIMLAVGVAR